MPGNVLAHQQQKEELFYPSAMTGSFLPPMGPRLNLRRRQTGILPTVGDSADDLDNLDDVRLPLFGNVIVVNSFNEKIFYIRHTIRL